MRFFILQTDWHAQVVTQLLPYLHRTVIYLLFLRPE